MSTVVQPSRFRGGVVIRGIDAEHEARFASGDAEFAANQEAGAAEHALFGDARHVGQCGAEAFRERVVGADGFRALGCFWDRAFGRRHDGSIGAIDLDDDQGFFGVVGPIGVHDITD
jgi:hypothetical protein